MKKLLYLSLLFVFGISTTTAQELVPIGENPIIQRYLLNAAKKQPQEPLKRPGAIEKNDCPVLNTNELYVIAGESIIVKIEIDTAGLGTGVGSYSCLGCQNLAFGAATVSGDTLRYNALPNVEGGKENIRVQFCKGSNCRTRTYRIVAKRENLKHFQRSVKIGTDSSVLVLANESLLPGRKATCSFLVDCADKYEGRNQAYTLFPNLPTRLIYRSDFYAGVDSVCMVMCDTFAICDTFSFAFIINRDTLNLPFMDDFSYTGPFPDRAKWLDRDAFVNTDMADTPPSIGVATFDGLNDQGTAYGGGFGEADRLTSTYLNLSGISKDVYLTYWLQRRGFADKPEPLDSVVLEFKDRSGKWNPIQGFPGVPVNQPNTEEEPFRFYRNLIPNEYKYKGFQFRFKNYSDRTGILDVWHLDYVRVDGGSFTDSVFTDIAFTKQADFILDKYNSMPWQHFKANALNELRDSVRTNVWNHSEITRSLSSSHAELFETVSNTRVYFVRLFNGEQGNIPNGMSINRVYPYVYGQPDPGNPDRFPSTAWDSLSRIMTGPAFDNYDSLTFRLEYVLENSAEETTGGYAIPVKANNSTRRLTTFYNYFSYDDGTAEAGLIAQAGVQVALEYTANVEDSLRAIQVHFPRTTIDISNQEFNLQVWIGALDNSPEYERLLLRPVYTDVVFDTLQGFTTYLLVDEVGNPQALHLPPGKFYIGWQQVTSCDGTKCVPVGYDRNTPQGRQFMYRNINGQWQSFPTAFPSGSLMLRPVVGSVTPPPTTSVNEKNEKKRNFDIFPNPTRSWLNILPLQGDYDDFYFRLFSSTGQILAHGALSAQLDVSAFPAGIYFLKITDRRTNQIWNERFIIGK